MATSPHKMDLVEDMDNTSIINSIYLDTPELCESFLGNTNQLFTVITQNIRSIRKNFTSFAVFLSRLGFSPDIIVLTECWLDSSFTYVTWNGYNCHSSKNFLNQNDGLVILSKSNLNIQIHEPPFKDGNCLIANIDNTYTIIAIYRSPSISNIDNFLDSLQDVIVGIKCETLIITGDMNIDIKSKCSDITTADKYLNMVGHYGLISGHELPTRGPNCLDHVLVRSKHKVNVAVCISDVTDHDALLTGIEHKTQQSFQVANLITKTNYTKLIQELEETDWSQLYKQTDINNAVDYFTDTLHSATKCHQKEETVKNSKYIRKNWITPGLIKSIKKRDALHLNYRNNPLDPTIEKQYKNYRNGCNNLLQCLKNEFDCNLIKEGRGNIKKMWDAIKTVTDIKNLKSKNSNLLSLKTSPCDSLNYINQFLANIGETLATDILNKLKTTEIKLANLVKLSNPKPNSFFLHPTDESEIMSVLSSLKIYSAPGPDEISNKILKLARTHLVRPITYLCNLSMSTGVVPNSFKVANVCPIYKAGDPKEVANYRPISLLGALSKLLEKIVNKRLINFLERNNTLSENQYGFRASRSTEDAVVALVNLVINKLDTGQKCVGIFLDLAKAFDTVSRPILLSKLEQSGIRGTTLDWFKSYLSNRKQRIKIESHYSDLSEISFGVPQGSVLGPSLFTLYINDLCKLPLKHANIFTFADDTALVFHGNSWEEVYKNAQLGLQLVTDWLNNNLLTLNASKTKFIEFKITNRKSSKPTQTLRVHSCGNANNQYCSCTEIERVSQIRYLGVIIDDKLSWQEHISLVCSRVRKLKYVFSRLKKVAGPDIIKMVYVSLCQSVLNYCVIVWGGACSTYLLRVERAQRALLKIAFNKPFRYPTKELYSDCKLLTVRQLYLLATALRFHTNAPEELKNTKRSQRQIAWKAPTVRTTFAQRSFSFVAPYTYSKMNKILDIYNCTRYICKRKITSWLSTLDYQQTEKILCIVK